MCETKAETGQKVQKRKRTDEGVAQSLETERAHEMSEIAKELVGRVAAQRKQIGHRAEESLPDRVAVGLGL